MFYGDDINNLDIEQVKSEPFPSGCSNALLLSPPASFQMRPNPPQYQVQSGSSKRSIVFGLESEGSWGAERGFQLGDCYCLLLFCFLSSSKDSPRENRINPAFKLVDASSLRVMHEPKIHGKALEGCFSDGSGYVMARMSMR